MDEIRDFRGASSWIARVARIQGYGEEAEGRVLTAAAAGVAAPRTKDRHQKAGTGRRAWSSGCGAAGSVPRASKNSQPCQQHLGIGLLASRTEKINFCCSKPPDLG